MLWMPIYFCLQISVYNLKKCTYNNFSFNKLTKIKVTSLIYTSVSGRRYRLHCRSIKISCSWKLIRPGFIRSSMMFWVIVFLRNPLRTHNEVTFVASYMRKRGFRVFILRSFFCVDFIAVYRWISLYRTGVQPFHDNIQRLVHFDVPWWSLLTFWLLYLYPVYCNDYVEWISSSHFYFRWLVYWLYYPGSNKMKQVHMCHKCWAGMNVR